MTVGELIEQLKQLDADLPAVVSGYEGGYHDATQTKAVNLVFDYPGNEAWYYGPHEEMHDWDDQMKANYTAKPAIWIG